jgi:hypothetical protein
MSIYDNISGDKLVTALKKTLEKAKRADFCIGYFNLRGWDLLLESVDALPGSHLDERFGDNFGYQTLIICPPDLQEMWNEYKLEYGLRAEVLSLGEVQNKLKQIRPFRIVIMEFSRFIELGRPDLKEFSPSNVWRMK